MEKGAPESQSDAAKEFNSQTIQKMGYKEIIEANRKQHANSFMDRSWRDNPELNGQRILDDPKLSFWQKITRGAYTYQSVSARFVNNFERTQTKVTFVEGILERKAEFADEEDKLLIKRSEMAIARKFNSYRVPFMAVSLTVCVMAALNPKFGLV